MLIRGFVTALAIIYAAPAANTQSPYWKINGDYVTGQSSTNDAAPHLVQEGNKLTGQARFYSASFNHESTGPVAAHAHQIDHIPGGTANMRPHTFAMTPAPGIPTSRPIHASGKVEPSVATDQCMPGFVWREAREDDHACVMPQSRQRTALENQLAAARRNPDGAYGPETCISGFVWREAFEGDTVCVTPSVRSLVKEENRQAKAHGAAFGAAADSKAAAQLALEQATGTAWIVDTDPRNGAVSYATPKNGAFALPATDSRVDAAIGFLAAHKRIFGMQDPKREWVVTRQSTLENGSTRIHFAQAVNNVPVYLSTWDAHFNSDGHLTSTSGTYVAGTLRVSTQARRSAEAAATRARACVAERANLPMAAFTTDVAELEIYPRRDARPALAWRVRVRSSLARFNSRTVHLEDRSGTVLADDPMMIPDFVRAESEPKRAYPAHCLPTGLRTPKS